MSHSLFTYYCYGFETCAAMAQRIGSGEEEAILEKTIKCEGKVQLILTYRAMRAQSMMGDVMSDHGETGLH